jgi:hypothetical protein
MNSFGQVTTQQTYFSNNEEIIAKKDRCVNKNHLWALSCLLSFPRKQEFTFPISRKTARPVDRHFKKIHSLETLLDIERGVIFLKRVQFFLIFTPLFIKKKW